MVLLDINLLDKNGIEVCKEIKGIYVVIKVIVFIMYSEVVYIFKMVKVGVDGYIFKNLGKVEII